MFPTPATLRWSSRNAFTGARLRRAERVELRAREVGPERLDAEAGGEERVARRAAERELARAEAPRIVEAQRRARRRARSGRAGARRLRAGRAAACPSSSGGAEVTSSSAPTPGTCRAGRAPRRAGPRTPRRSPRAGSGRHQRGSSTSSSASTRPSTSGASCRRIVSTSGSSGIAAEARVRRDRCSARSDRRRGRACVRGHRRGRCRTQWLSRPARACAWRRRARRRRRASARSEGSPRRRPARRRDGRHRDLAPALGAPGDGRPRSFEGDGPAGASRLRRATSRGRMDCNRGGGRRRCSSPSGTRRADNNAGTRRRPCPPRASAARRSARWRRQPARLLRMAQACGRVMEPGSSIANVGSARLDHGRPAAGRLSASKAAIIGLTRASRCAWAGPEGEIAGRRPRRRATVASALRRPSRRRDARPVAVRRVPSAAVHGERTRWPARAASRQRGRDARGARGLRRCTAAFALRRTGAPAGRPPRRPVSQRGRSRRRRPARRRGGARPPARPRAAARARACGRCREAGSQPWSAVRTSRSPSPRRSSQPATARSISCSARWKPSTSLRCP